MNRWVWWPEVSTWCQTQDFLSDVPVRGGDRFRTDRVCLLLNSTLTCGPRVWTSGPRVSRPPPTTGYLLTYLEEVGVIPGGSISGPVRSDRREWSVVREPVVFYGKGNHGVGDWSEVLDLE